MAVDQQVQGTNFQNVAVQPLSEHAHRLSKEDATELDSGADAATTFALATDLANPSNTLLLKRAAQPLPAGFANIELNDNHGNDISFQSFETVLVPGVDGDGGGRNSVKTDAQGRVVEVNYPNGTVRQLGYGEDGEIIKVVQPDGTAYVLVDGRWRVESSGSEETSAKEGHYVDFRNPKISADGTFSFEHREGGSTIIGLDGTSTTRKDGATILSDANGNVSSIVYSNGDRRTFTYDEHGNVLTVTENHFRTFTVKDGELYGPDGQPTGFRNPRIAQDGAYWLDDSIGNVIITLPNHSAITVQPDGSSLVRDADGQLTLVSYPDGRSRQLGYDQFGRLNSITDETGKQYKSTEGNYFLADEGVALDNVSLKPDGTLIYDDVAGKRHMDFVTGKSSETTKTVVELHETARLLAGKYDAEIRDVIHSLSAADRLALDEEYKAIYGVLLSDQLRQRTIEEHTENRDLEATLEDFAEAYLHATELAKIVDAKGVPGENYGSAEQGN